MSEQYETEYGVMYDVALRSGIKPVFGGLFWGCIGGFMIWGGVSMLLSELGKEGDAGIDPVFAGIALGVLLAGWIMFSILIRRVKAAADSSLYFRAGSGGVSVRCPAGIKLISILLSYRIKTMEFPWSDIRRWYPYLLTKGIIPVESKIVFEFMEGREFGVDTKFFKGTRTSISEAISRLIGQAETYDAGEQSGPEHNDEEGDFQ